MKRILGMTLGIVLVLLLVMSVALADEEKQSGAFTYRIKGNGTAVITGYDWENYQYDWESDQGEDIYIPRMVDGYTVTEIGEFAFSAFYFDDNGNPEISDDKFEICIMAVSIVIPDTITTIGKGAFFGIRSASKAINIPASVEYIGDGAFSYIHGVEQFTVGTQNPVYATIDGVLFNKKEKALIAFPCDKQGITKDTSSTTTYYTIPDGITTIANYACYGFNPTDVMGRKLIDVVVFPETITSIGNYSFAYANIITDTNGQDLVLPKSVSQLGVGAFREANKKYYMDEKTIDLGLTSLHEIPDYAFYGTCVDSVIFPKQVETIGAYAFSECKRNRLAKFFIPSSVKTIKEGAFSSKDFCASFEFEEGSQLQTIGDCAFEGTSVIGNEEFVLPSGLKDIGKSAFKNCKYLEILTIPASVTSIGKDVCTRESVYLNVEPGSYAALWASENGYMTTGTGAEDTSWLTAP